jgi:hypothetical protein
MENKIAIDLSKLQVVPIEQVRPNSWNPKDKDTKEYQDVKASIERKGLYGFIIVRENEKDGVPFEIIDGEQRYTACKELGYEKILIYNAGVVDDRTAQEDTIWMQVQAPFNELSLAKLISKMVEDYGSISTPYSQKKIEEMQELAKFSFDKYTQTSTKPPQMPSGDLLKTFSVQMPSDKYDILQNALDKARKAVKEESPDLDVNDARALEFVCVEYLNQAEGQ